jgi:hypothetical protein
MTRHSPPAIACLLLDSVLLPHSRDEILGDLIEEHALRADAKSGFEASRWFWSQTCRSLAWSSLGGGWVWNLATAIAVCVVTAALKIGADFAIARLFQPREMTQVVLAPILFIAATTVAGCVAVDVRRGAMVFLSLIVFVAVGVLIALNVCTIPVPWWYKFSFLTIGPASVFAAPIIRHSLKGLTIRRINLEKDVDRL